MQFCAFQTFAAQSGLAVKITPEPQNTDYESGRVEFNGQVWHIRTARTTPTKPGAFVAFWRRDANGKTAPFASDGTAAGLMVFVEQIGRRGLFQFTARQLADLGITAGRSGGKRGFRVYPPWCVGLSNQASATQRAQAPAFREY